MSGYDATSEVAILHDNWIVVNEMLRDRNYIITDTDTAIDQDAFVQRFHAPPLTKKVGVDRRPMMIITHKHDDPSKSVCVQWHQAISVAVIRNVVQRMEEMDCTNAILIAVQKPTPMGMRAAIEACNTHGVFIELFLQAELRYNITKHVLVPPHTILSVEEKKLLLTRYRMTAPQLPRMQIDDPVARYYGLVRGQVTKIVRPSETAGRYTTYRMVV